jgi:hypothetical protein
LKTTKEVTVSPPVPAPDQGSTPDNPGVNWCTIPADQVAAVSAAFDAAGMSPALTSKVKRVFGPPTRRLTLVSRNRGARRVDRRPRERREQRHTARSTSSGDSGDPDSEPPRLRGRDLRHVSLALTAELYRLAAHLTRGGAG